ncbi:hypothetical protein [Vulcanisaeta sp. JCM 16161]|uniref:hypothetical protein n=1 Tax=Vulcanisaeta sp. JCM 16161 TaxID=1295372 RepID=UPI0006CF5A61|nr:hypothetical protein [Vulcanisaeta sp. JCM 16161]
MVVKTLDTYRLGLRRLGIKLNSDAVTAIVGLIVTIGFMAFIRFIRPINLSLHRDVAGMALFLITALFFLWLLISSIREQREHR